MVRPTGLVIVRAQAGQVEDVPRSSTRYSPIPASSALSRRTAIKAADLPLPQPQIVPPPGLPVEDTTRVADGHRPDPLLHGPVDDRAGSLVLRLPDPAAVAAFDQAGAAAGFPPPPRPSLPLAAGPGRRWPDGGPWVSVRCRRCSARIARPDTSSACRSGQATA